MGRLAALALAVMMTLSIAPQRTEAVLSGVYFTAVNDELLDLRDDTMPFWSDGHLYVSNAIFTGIYGSALGIRCAYNSIQQTAVVFSNRFGALGFTSGAQELLARHRRGEGAKP